MIALTLLLLLTAESPGFDASDANVAASAAALCRQDDRAPCEVRFRDSRDRLLTAWNSSATSDADRDLMLAQVAADTDNGATQWFNAAIAYFAKRQVASQPKGGRDIYGELAAARARRATTYTRCDTYMSKNYRYVSTTCRSY